MKRILIPMLLLLLLFSACTAKIPTAEQSGEGCLLYYVFGGESFGPDSLLQTETFAPTGELTARTLAARYLSGPETETLRSLLPRNVELLESEQKDGVLRLLFSSELSKLGSAELTLAAACICKTFSQLEGVEAVELRADGAMLNGSRSMTLYGDSILLQDEYAAQSENTVNVYYPDLQLHGLLSSPTELRSDTAERSAAYLIELLREPADSQTMRSLLPAGAELLDISIEGDICILDFSEEFYGNRPTSEKEERLLILSIVNTLTELEEIHAVRFYVEGENPGIYFSLDLDTNFVRDESVIGTPKR